MDLTLNKHDPEADQSRHTVPALDLLFMIDEEETPGIYIIDAVAGKADRIS